MPNEKLLYQKVLYVKKNGGLPQEKPPRGVLEDTWRYTNVDRNSEPNSATPSALYHMQRDAQGKWRPPDSDPGNRPMPGVALRSRSRLNFAEGSKALLNEASRKASYLCESKGQENGGRSHDPKPRGPRWISLRCPCMLYHERALRRLYHCGGLLVKKRRGITLVPSYDGDDLSPRAKAHRTVAGPTKPILAGPERTTPHSPTSEGAEQDLL